MIGNFLTPTSKIIFDVGCRRSCAGYRIRILAVKHFKSLLISAKISTIQNIPTL